MKEEGTQQKSNDYVDKERIPIDTAWFKGAISDAKTSQRQLAIKMKLDPAAMSLMLNGFRKMSVAEASEIAELLGKPLEDVIRRAGGSGHLAGQLRTPSEIAAMGGARLAASPRPGPDSDAVMRHMDAAAGAVDVVGWVDSAGVVHRERPIGPSSVDRPPGVPQGSVALRMLSQDMWDGWLVFYKPGAGVGADAVGQMCVVERADGVVLLRFVSHGYEAGKWTLGGGLWPREDGVELVSAAPVLWMKQR